jgi:hypothetical protein
VHEVDLAPAIELLLDAGAYQLGIVRGDDRVNGQAVLGGSLDDRHVAQPRQRHVQGARNRRGRHGQHVHVLLDLLQALFVAHAEALFLVHDQQAQIAKLDILRQEAVRPDDDIDFAVRQVRQPGGDLLRRDETAEHLHAHGERREAPPEGLVVLEAEHGGGREQRHLPAVAQGLERGAHGDLGFAEAHIAAHEPIHRLPGLHVALDVADGSQLVLGLGEFEGVFELPLPVAVRRKGKTLGHAPLGVELEQLLGHVVHPGLDPLLRALPGDAAEFVQRGGPVARAAEPLHQVHAGQGHVQLGLPGVFEQHVVASLSALGDLAEAVEPADAVLDVDHIVAGLEVRQVDRERAQVQPASGPGDEFGGVEEVLGTENGDRRIHEHRSAPDLALHQDGAGHRPREVGAFRQEAGFTGGRLHPQLEGDGVLLEDVGQSLQLTGRRGEEHRARALRYYVPHLGHGDRHVAMEGHRGPRRNMQVPGAGAHRQLGEQDLGCAFQLRLELLPAEERLFRRTELSARSLIQALPEASCHVPQTLHFVADHDWPLQ